MPSIACLMFAGQTQSEYVASAMPAQNRNDRANKAPAQMSSNNPVIRITVDGNGTQLGVIFRSSLGAQR